MTEFEHEPAESARPRVDRQDQPDAIHPGRDRRDREEQPRRTLPPEEDDEEPDARDTPSPDTASDPEAP
jgi:hypothetical protein